MPSQNTLVDHLVSSRTIKSPVVEKVFRRIDRKLFCPADLPASYAYQDSPAGIGCNQTISAPHMHATCMELCKEYIEKGGDEKRVLDVGSGSGYLTATFAALLVELGKTGKVYGVEKYPELAKQSVKNIQSACPDLMPYINITSGNVWEGVDEGGFDVIHVGAAAAKLPEVLVTALNKGGRMVIPVGGQNDVQVMQVVVRLEDGSIKKQDLMAVRYVPLTRPGEDDLYLY